MAEFGARRGPLLVLAFACLAAGCDREIGHAATESAPPRGGRFGSLRDFVLFEVPSGGASPRWLFVDRFEVTRADWFEFAATAAGARVAADAAAGLGDGALPQGFVSLRQARAFAAWRFGRLPRLEEWQAVVRGQRYTFPWGNKADATRANTAELGLGEPTLVGTFESGRRENGQPYDLIGNVSEWTETVPADWCVPEVVGDQGMSLAYAAGWRTAIEQPALALWQPLPGLIPELAAVASHSDVVPRAVVGADFQSPMDDPDRDGTQLAPPESVLGADRRLRTGLRLMTTPVELLLALAQEPIEPTVEDYEQLRRFVARRNHRAVLVPAWTRVAAQLTTAQGDQPLARWLSEQLLP